MDDVESTPPEEPRTGRPSRKSKVLAMQGLQNMSAKKKKEPNQQHEHHSDDGSGDEHSNESDADVEETKRPRRQKKTANNTTTNLAPLKRGRKPGSKNVSKRLDATSVSMVTTGGRRNYDDAMMGGSEGSLFSIVKQGQIALTTVVDEWIESYKRDRDTHLLELIQFFIHASGCKGQVTLHMYNTMEHAEIIRKMTEEFDEESGDYPLIMSGPQWKKFKVNFCDFISTLVRQCQYSIIYDQYLMDNVISLLTGLTDSQVRAFRHTSTFAAMKLMTSLVDVALNLSIALDHTQRQLEAEQSKSKNKQAADRLELLVDKKKETEENLEEIRHMLTYIFKGVFVHRYRDIRPEIRVICTNEIAVWMKRYPTMFLDDSYLKYIGWTLCDRVGEVRLSCLKCLQPLYDTEEFAPKLELFTNRFKDRIVEMTLDKEYDVSVQAVKLVISIFKSNEAILQDKDCENVYELVYSSHRGLAQAAGEFLTAKLFTTSNHGNNSSSGAEMDLSSSSQQQGKRGPKGKKSSENAPYWRDLVLFFIESELHEHGSYLIDSLWDSCPMLKDWECMTGLLLDEPTKEEDVLDDKQETSLIELMVCCVKQASTGEYPVGRGVGQRKLGTKELKQIAEDRARMTEHFIVALSQLLAKYTMHSEKTSNLLNIPMYFDLEIYTTGRHEKQLDLFLNHIDTIVEQQTDPEVLNNCSKVLETFCNDDYIIGNKCNVFRMTLLDKIVGRYFQACASFFEKGSDPTEDDTFALFKSLERVQAFYSCHDMNNHLSVEAFSKIFKDKYHAPKEILCKGIGCSFLSIFWQVASLTPQNINEDSLKSVRKRLKGLMEKLCLLLSHHESSVQEEAYVSICDLLIVFNKNLGHNNPALAPLVYTPDLIMQDHLISFLKERVFVEDDDESMDENQKIEELHKRRNHLASFCKLIIYNVLKIKQAADMFKYYIKFYNDYGDIIKLTLSKAKEINKVQTAKTLALSLTQLFSVLQTEFPDEKIETNSEGFIAIKDLARRFSQSFGLDMVKIREAIAYMHKDGILFVVNGNRDPETGVPNNLAFLEILCEFSVKLMKQDKKVVLSYLDNHFQNCVEEWGDDGSSLAMYRHSLLMGDQDVTAATVANNNRTAFAAAANATGAAAAGGGGGGKAAVKKNKPTAAKRKLSLDGEDSNPHHSDTAKTPPRSTTTTNTTDPHPELRRSTRVKRSRLNEEEEQEEDGDDDDRES